MIAIFENIIEKIKVMKKNRIGAANTSEENVPYDEIKDDPDAPIEQDKKDKNPGKIKLNGGEHESVYGINRKLLSVVLVFVLVTVGAMWSYSMQDKKEAETAKQEAKKSNIQDTAAKVTYDNPDYDDMFTQQQQGLAGANARFRNRGNSDSDKATSTVDPQNKPNAQNTEQTSESQIPVTSSPPVVATPTLPQIPSHSYATSMPTTSTQVATPKTQSESEAEQKENERKSQIAERYKSSISFSLNNNNSGESMAQSVATSAGTGNNGKTLASTNQSPFPSSPIQYMAASDGVLQAGTLIPAVLFSGINTNVAGQVTAQTMTDVYDTATRSNLLIPAGSQLIGSYESGASSGNNRVNVIFSTLVLPDGSSYAIDNSMVAVDGAGYNGIAGKLDHHTDQALRNGILNSMFSAISSKWADRVYLDMSNIANISKMDGIRPTITINPGKEFNLFVTKPIIFVQ